MRLLDTGRDDRGQRMRVLRNSGLQMLEGGCGDDGGEVDLLEGLTGRRNGQQRHVVHPTRCGVESVRAHFQADGLDQAPAICFEDLVERAERNVVHDARVAQVIIDTAIEKRVTTVCIGKPHISLFRIILRTNLFNQLLKTLSSNDIDLIILS